MKNLCLTIALSSLTGLTGCFGVGPKTIPRDRFDYGEAISRSFKEQMLLNIVRMRYVDAPLFVEVSSVINQYSLEGQVSTSSTWKEGMSGDTFSIGAGGKFADRPTITYAPLVGQKFTKSLMTPLPPGAILFLVQSGWSVDFVFATTIQAINGIYNRASAPGRGRMQADPKFGEALAAMSRIQRSGAIGMRVVDPDKPESAVLVLRRREAEGLVADVTTVKDILRLPDGEQEFLLTYGADATEDNHIAVQTRSLLEIMTELASEIDVPVEHVEEGRTYATFEAGDGAQSLIQVESGLEKPDDAFVAVRYRDHYYWIDDKDMSSKRIFTFLSILYNVTQTGEGAVPLLTVPA